MARDWRGLTCADAVSFEAGLLPEQINDDVVQSDCDEGATDLGRVDTGQY